MVPGEVLTHEYMHSLDANLNRSEDASFLPRGNTSGDSIGFYNEFQNKIPVRHQKGLNLFLKRYPNDEVVKDFESFAQYAAPQANKVMLGSLRNSYGQIFTPATKQLNYSPVYPTSLYEDIFNQLEKSNYFR